MSRSATALLTYMPQQPFAVPGAFLLFLSVRSGSRRALLYSAAALLVALFGLLDLRLGWPAPARPAAGAPLLSVLTYNIHMGTGGLDRLAAVLREAHPDVICLQEATPRQGTFTDTQVRRLLPGYQFARTGGRLTASRLPIERAMERRFHEPGLWRTALQVDVRARGQTVHILNIHYTTGRNEDHTPGEPTRTGRWKAERWGDSASVRMAQTEKVLGWVEEMQGPVIVMGDFNTPPRGLAYRRLTSTMQSAFDRTGRGFGYTWNTRLPLLRIDHVFAAHGARPIRCRVLPARASDHRPVLADIALAP